MWLSGRLHIKGRLNEGPLWVLHYDCLALQVDVLTIIYALYLQYRCHQSLIKSNYPEKFPVFRGLKAEKVRSVAELKAQPQGGRCCGRAIARYSFCGPHNVRTVGFILRKELVLLLDSYIADYSTVDIVYLVLLQR